MVAFSLAVLYLRYVALPDAESWRPRVVASIEAASGMAVSMKRLEGGWDGLRPSLTLHGFALADRRGKAALAFERAEVTLAWHALLFGQLRFHEVELDSPELNLRRGSDGLIYLADKPLNGAGPDDGEFSRWLLSQPRLRIRGATLAWRDELAGAPEVRLSSVQISVQRKAARHVAALTAVPPPHLAGRIDLRADVALERMGDRWSAAGTLFAEAIHTDLAKLRAHLPLPETLRSGTGSVRVWLAFSAAGVREVTADIDMRDARAQFASDVLPLDLATVTGRAVYRAEPGGFYFGTEGLRFRTPSGIEAQPGSFSVSHAAEKGREPRGEIRADGIDLKIAAALLDYFPVPRDAKEQVLRFAPRGTISKAEFTWTGESPAKAKSLAVRASFRDLAVNAVEGLPGLSGLSGSIEGNDREGLIRLASKGAVLEAASIFRAPIALDSLDARARWKRTGAVLEVAVEEARFANAHAQGEAKGLWRSLPDSKDPTPGYLELKGTLERADVRAVAHYLPNWKPETRAYLDRAILDGRATRASFEVKGDLWNFPFADDREGRFLIEGDVRGGRLRYHPDWPAIDAIDGTVRFEGTRMEIRAERARIFASAVRNASAIVENLGADPPVLVVEGAVDAVGADAMRFLRESPLLAGPGAFTRVVTVEGPATLGLKVRFPLWGTEHAKVAGEYTFAGATASAGKSLAMSGIKGRLSFTEKGVRAPELTGSMFGDPAVLRLASQPDGTVLTTLDGRIGAVALGDFVPEPIAMRLTGGLDWRARVATSGEGTDLTVESDLKGLASSLPEPFAKRASDARPLAIAIRRLGSESETATARLAGGIHGRFGVRGPPEAPRRHAALKFGAPVGDEPVRDGIWLYGELPVLDLDAWQAAFPPRGGTGADPSAAPAIELRGLDLRLGRVSFTRRAFSDVAARLERSATGWKGHLDAPNVAGEVSWNPEGRGHIVANLSRFVLRPVEGAEAAPGPSEGDGDLPALDIVAERFDFKGNILGKLELKAAPDGEAWRIERLDIGNGPTQFRSSGAWRRTSAGSITTLDMKLETTSLNRLFDQFGYGEYVRRGQANLEGKLAWPGFPYEFALGAINGTFKVGATRGQFAKFEPGAGKLLGLLSLQSLPRRVTFDFRDIFSEGFAFERISGSVRVARGVLLTDDFEISGPAAFVSMEGEVSLPQETQALLMRVVPEVGESVALAATVLGTPVLGLSALLVSKLLQNPLGKAVAYEYRVTGTWDNPVVTPVSVPPRGAASAAPPAPAGAPRREPGDAKAPPR